MAKFDKYKKLEVSATKILSYQFPQLDGNVSVEVAPAIEANKVFFNALLRRSRKNSKAIAAGAMNTNLLSQNRDEDRELYAQYIIKNWNNVTDDDGKAVEFNTENCLGFLQSLPDYIFDGLRTFCSEVTNFTDESTIDAGAIAKNL